MSRHTPIALISVTLGLLALSGCSRFHPPLVFDLQSVNVASLPPGWPEHEDLTPAQQSVLDELGEPDYLRARWDRRGRLSWGDEIWTTYRRSRLIDIMLTAHHRDQPMPFEISWIYQAEDQHPYRRIGNEVFRGEEVIFIDDEVEYEPVSAQLGTIIDLGDPEERRQPEAWGDHLIERWIYYKEGKIYHYIDGIIERVELIPPTPVRVRREI